jgi:dTDP-4-amino-4,6-dideoxygalactose transaminase
MIPTFSPTIRRKEMDAVLTCMVDEKIGPGDICARLIESIKEFFNVEGAIALRSPVRALEFALNVLGLEPGSAVMLSALAPAWQYAAVNAAGFRPLLLDVSPDTALVTPEIAATGIENGGRALVLHESLGILPDIDAFAVLGVPIIEDISQSAGAMQNGKKAGTFGVFSILGLEEHDIVTAGGGAMILAPLRRDWAALKKYADDALSADLLPDINAALAFVQLKEYGKNERRRKEIYVTYFQSLMQSRHKTFPAEISADSRDEKGSAGVEAVDAEQAMQTTSAAYGFPVIISSGYKEVKQYAARKDIEISLAFAGSIAERFGDELTDCPAAKSLALRCALFPLYPRLSGAQITNIARVLAALP